MYDSGAVCNDPTILIGVAAAIPLGNREQEMGTRLAAVQRYTE